MSTIRASNATNVRLYDGGLVIKQGDTASSFGFELLDEQKKPIDLTGQEATVYLVHRTEGKWSQKVAIEDSNKVSFTIGDVLYLGRYILEIHAGGYVFPSDRSVVLTIVKSEVTYASEDMAKLKEIDTDIIVDKVVTAKKLASKDELAQAKAEVLSEVESKHYLTEHQDISGLAKRSELPAPYDDSPLKAQISQISGQIATLEGRVDNDTIYDDSELREAVSSLESKVDNLPKVDTSNLATKAELEDYAKKSDLPKPYNDAPVQEFIAKEPQRRLEIEAEFQRLLKSSLENLESKLSQQPDNLLSPGMLVDGLVPAQFQLSTWASIFINTDNLKKILIPGNRYTFSFETRFVKKSSVRKVYAKSVGFLMYDYGKPGTVAVFYTNGEFSLNGPVLKFSQTFICPELSERTVFLAYTRRYQDGNDVDYDTFEFLNMRLVRVID